MGPRASRSTLSKQSQAMTTQRRGEKKSQGKRTLCGHVEFNPHSLSYVNASIIAIVHVLEESGGVFGRLQFLKKSMMLSTQYGKSLKLTTNLMFRSLLPRWQFNQVQRDVEDFATQLLEVTGVMQCVRVSRASLEGGNAEEQGGAPVFMPILDQPARLQDIINAWARTEAVTRFVLQFDRAVVVQLGRFGEGQQVFIEVTFAEEVSVPVMSACAEVSWLRFWVAAVVFHTGRTCHAGHCQAAPRVRDQWCMDL